MTDIAELRRLEAEARPGPWGLKGPNEAGDFTVGQIAQDDQEKDIEQDRKDAALIVAMRNALPELLKALETPASWRWKPKYSSIWIYDPSEDWLANCSNDPDIDIEPLYALPPHGGENV